MAINSPDVPDYRQDPADSQYHLAALLAKLPGKQKEAEDGYRQALALQGKLATELHQRPGYRREQARTLNNLGILLNSMGNKDAEATFRRALKIQDELVRQNP